MYVELVSKLNIAKKDALNNLLDRAGLSPDYAGGTTALLWDDGTLIATGTLDGNLIKCVAVDKMHQGEGHTATIVTGLRKEAFAKGINHLFLYTKPENRTMFSDLFFYPVACTDKVLLMEDRKEGINNFLSQFPSESASEKVGAVVMNCNPFTLGHQYLIETALKSCDKLYVFVVTEDKSRFSAEARMEMVRRGTGHLAGVTVLPTGPYMVSSVTFPTYFLKERDRALEVQCHLDIEIFLKYFAPKFGITHRFVGTEPVSPMTNQYNKALKEQLPAKGIVLKEIPRLEIGDMPVSASRVRELIDTKDIETLKKLVPHTTYNFLIENNLI